MDYLEEIKLRLPIEDLVSNYVNLKKSGRNYKAFSPFKEEKTPSFMVSPDKGIAYCFATQQGGDIFKIFQLLEGLDFKETVKILAERTGVKLPHNFSSENQEKKDKKLESLEILKVLNSFYQKRFEESEIAKDYWQKRGQTEEIRSLFKIGYAPNSFKETSDYLIKQNYSLDLLVKLGISIKKNNNEYYDRFRDRLIIPIFNHHNELIAFGARILNNNKDQAKYLNSPESLLYSKKNVLFGLNLAKEFILKEKSVYVVEGYLDLITAFSLGLKNVVAVSGTALTQEQLNLLKRYTKKIILAFDQDQAGVNACFRSIPLCLNQDFEVEILKFNEAKDLDELAKKGEDVFKSKIKNTLSPLDFYFEESLKNKDLSKLNDQKQFCLEIFAVIENFEDILVKQYFLKKIAEDCKLSYQVINNEYQKFLNKNKKFNKKDKKDNNFDKKYLISLEEYLLGLIYSYPEEIEYLDKKLILQIFPDNEIKTIYKTLFANYNDGALGKKLFKDLDQEKIKIYALFIEEKMDENFDFKQETQKTVNLINKKNLQKKSEEIVMQMKETPEKSEKLALKLIEIQKLSNLI
jgi:DNA primase